MNENTHRNIVYLRSRKLERRKLAEEYCKIAETLTIPKKMLFLLYYRHGYSTVEISKLLGRHSSSIQRRLHRIEKKIKRLLEKQAGSQSPQPAC